MRRTLRIAGYAALVIAGVVAGAVVEPWPLVWLLCFPAAYAGGLGMYMTIKEENGNNRNV